MGFAATRFQMRSVRASDQSDKAAEALIGTHGPRWVPLPRSARHLVVILFRGALMRFESLRRIAAALSQDRSLALLLQHIVGELGNYRALAIARIWLFGPAEQCEICRAKPEERELPPSLHLAASAGRPL